MANFMPSNFASSESASYHLKKLYIGTINCIYYVMGTDFTMSCHALFKQVVESLLSLLHEHPVLLCESFLLELHCFWRFRHLNTHQPGLISQCRPNQWKIPTSNMRTHVMHAECLRNMYRSFWWTYRPGCTSFISFSL